MDFGFLNRDFGFPNKTQNPKIGFRRTEIRFQDRFQLRISKSGFPGHVTFSFWGEIRKSICRKGFQFVEIRFWISRFNGKSEIRISKSESRFPNRKHRQFFCVINFTDLFSFIANTLVVGLQVCVLSPTV